MNNKDLNTFYNKLTTKLKNDLVFFIPKAILDKNTLKTIEIEENLSMLFDNVLIIELNNGAFIFDSIEDLSRCIRKPEELTEIIFLLLEKKDALQDFQFSFIVDKYFEQVEFLFYITNWFSLNIEKLDNADFKFKGLFKTQQKYYKQHLEDFIRNFYPNKTYIPKDKLDLLKLIKVNFKDLTNTSLNKEILPEKTKEIFTNLIDEKQKEVKQTKIKPIKKVLVTEEESEKFILRTVFNIDI
ncbi:hypothetical protein [Lacinutrix chionoecetis]